MRERKGNRLKNYNYSQEGYYFVTICTKDREEWFGRVDGDEMRLNKFGEIGKISGQRLRDILNTLAQMSFQ